jgi:hypothetical protein
VSDREFFQQRVEDRFPAGTGLDDHLENGTDVVLDRKTPEYGRLLG